MEDAPRPKPVTHSTTVVRSSTHRTTPRPNRPSPVTARPITAPERNAIFRALFIPDSSAAYAVLTLPSVATFIPKKPASTDSSAPHTYKIPVIQLIKSPISRNRTTITIAMTLYSLVRNAIAPSRMNPAISFIRSLPSSALLIHEARPTATTSPIIAATTAIIAKPFIDNTSLSLPIRLEKARFRAFLIVCNRNIKIN